VDDAKARTQVTHAKTLNRYCAKGHPTHPDPPSHPLVRLPCGCALATATQAAMAREYGPELAVAIGYHERAALITANVKDRGGQASRAFKLR
jgi:hypothetical protein